MRSTFSHRRRRRAPSARLSPTTPQGMVTGYIWSPRPQAALSRIVALLISGGVSREMPLPAADAAGCLLVSQSPLPAAAVGVAAASRAMEPGSGGQQGTRSAYRPKRAPGGDTLHAIRCREKSTPRSSMRSTPAPEFHCARRQPGPFPLENSPNLMQGRRPGSTRWHWRCCSLRQGRTAEGLRNRVR